MNAKCEMVFRQQLFTLPLTRPSWELLTFTLVVSFSEGNRFLEKLKLRNSYARLVLGDYVHY